MDELPKGGTYPINMFCETTTKMYLLCDGALLQYKMKYHAVLVENEKKVFIGVFETKCF